MRTVIVVVSICISLLAATNAVVSQDVEEPSPDPVNPLCGFAFSRATTELTRDDGADEAGEFRTADPGPSPSPVPNFLDDAIRACADLDDFLGGSDLHPTALGERDPLTFLIDRCQDPEAGLGAYAVCESMERALATPAPTAETAEDEATDAANTLPTAEPIRKATPIKRYSRLNRRETKVARGYLKSADRTYVLRLPLYVDRLRDSDPNVPGLDETERASREAEGKRLREGAMALIGKHKQHMKDNRPAKCFSDAYSADRWLANRWLKQLKTESYGSADTAAGRAANHQYDRLELATDAFAYRLAKRYLEDCE